MVSLSDRLGGYRSEVAFKFPVRCATTAALTSLSSFQTIDGITFASTDDDNGYNTRVLVKNQTDDTTNGVYIVQSGNWARAKDFDGNGDIVKGTRVYVQGGTVNGGNVFVLTTADPVVIDTSDITFVTESSLYGAGIECVFDNGGAALSLGISDVVEAPFAGIIQVATLVLSGFSGGLTSGSLTVDVRKCTYAQYDAGVTHPVAGDSITAAAPLSVSSSSKAQDATLSGWTTSVSKGDMLQFIVTATDANVTKATASLRFNRTSP